MNLELCGEDDNGLTSYLTVKKDTAVRPTVVQLSCNCVISCDLTFYCAMHARDQHSRLVFKEVEITLMSLERQRKPQFVFKVTQCPTRAKEELDAIPVRWLSGPGGTSISFNQASL